METVLWEEKEIFFFIFFLLLYVSLFIWFYFYFSFGLICVRVSNRDCRKHKIWLWNKIQNLGFVPFFSLLSSRGRFPASCFVYFPHSSSSPFSFLFLLLSAFSSLLRLTPRLPSLPMEIVSHLWSFHRLFYPFVEGRTPPGRVIISDHWLPVRCCCRDCRLPLSPRRSWMMSVVIFWFFPVEPNAAPSSQFRSNSQPSNHSHHFLSSRSSPHGWAYPNHCPDSATQTSQPILLKLSFHSKLPHHLPTCSN